MIAVWPLNRVSFCLSDKWKDEKRGKKAGNFSLHARHTSRCWRFKRNSCFCFQLFAFDGIQRCNSTLIEITPAIERQFSQRLLSSYWSPTQTPPTFPHSFKSRGISRWELSGWERSFQPKAFISLHAKPAGWLSGLAMSPTVADSPLRFNHTQEGGINRSPLCLSHTCLCNFQYTLHLYIHKYAFHTCICISLSSQ